MRKWLGLPTRELENVFLLDKDDDAKFVSTTSKVEPTTTFLFKFLQRKQVALLLSNTVTNHHHYYGDVENPHNLTNVSFLLSLLQKQVRRSDQNSVCTAFLLMRLDCTKFLRRWVIIMLEDVDVFEGAVEKVVWLMLCKDDREEHIPWLLGLVYSTTVYPTRRDMVALRCERLMFHCHSTLGPYRNLILALILRSEHGGMKCDMQMFYGVCNKLQNGTLHPAKDLKIRCIVPESVEPLTRDVILLEAVDFHCSRIVQWVCKKCGGEYSEAQIRDYIWNCRSSINTRTVKKVSSMPENIRRFVWSYSKFFIDKCL